VSPVRVFDGQVMQAELALDEAEQRLLGLVQPNPDEALGLTQQIVDLLEGDIGDAPTA
jgi:hypothetical protein